MSDPELDTPRVAHAAPAAAQTTSAGLDDGVRPGYAAGDPVIVLATLTLGAAVGLGVASMFPAYLSGLSIASQPDLVAAHAIPLAGWLAAAVLVATARRGARQLGGLVGVGIGVVELGFLLSDAGTVFSGGGHLGGAGLVLATLEWLLATGACALVVARSGTLTIDRPLRRRRLGNETGASRPRVDRHSRTTGWVAAAAAVVAAGLYAPPWDRLVVDLTAVGRTTVVTAGNAFANPAPVVVGNVVVIACLAALPLAALVLHPRRLGGALLAGGVVAAASQVVSALVQWREPVPPSEFGLSAQAATASGLQASTGFTPMFYGFVAAVLVLGIVAVARLLRDPDRQEPTHLAPVHEIPTRRPFSPTPHY